MIHFESLTPEELNILEDAIPQIAVLIAGAEGKIDVKETDWAAKLTHIRTYNSSEDLHEFYKQIDANFAIKFAELKKFSSSETEIRQTNLSENLSKLNPILAKLDHKTAYHLYDSFLSFAKNIANLSGGVLGFHSLSKEEKKWVGLPMINPIAPPLS